MDKEIHLTKKDFHLEWYSGTRVVDNPADQTLPPIEWG